VTNSPLAINRHGGHRAAAGLGLTLVLSGSLLLCVSDALAKIAFERAPLSQYIVLSGLLVLPGLLAVMAATRQLGVLRIGNRRALVLRAACMVGSTFFFFAGLQRLPLGDTYALAFMAPVFALALAAWILKEHVGWRRWSAVLAGFAGVILAMLPTGQGYGWTAALFPLAAAACGAIPQPVPRLALDRVRRLPLGIALARIEQVAVELPAAQELAHNLLRLGSEDR
jgi:drug/metabolite transporter (DMT)-like permease